MGKLISALNRLNKYIVKSESFNNRNEIETQYVKSLYQDAIEQTDSPKKKVIENTVKGGHEFEDIVVIALSALGFHNVRKLSNGPDGGVDIRAEQKTPLSTIKFCIECKHQPNSAIGRPIVQKIDSATRNDGADKGMIISSGSFTAEAKEYAKKVGIELIDGDKLHKIFDTNGISYSFSKVPSESLPLSEYTNLKQFVEDYFDKRNIQGYRLMEFIPNRIIFEPIYSTKYSVNAIFSTTVGVIHRINKSGYFITDIKGNIINDDITKMIVEHIENFTSEQKKIAGFELETPTEFIPEEKLPNIVIEHLRCHFTELVSYMGNNGSYYRKPCKPNKSDVRIENSQQYLIPYWKVDITIDGKPYSITILDIFGKFTIIEDSSTSCNTCQSDAKYDSAVCSDCSNIYCEKHRYSCKRCGEIICEKCVQNVPELFLFSGHYCKKCHKDLDLKQKHKESTPGLIDSVQKIKLPSLHLLRISGEIYSIVFGISSLGYLFSGKFISFAFIVSSVVLISPSLHKKYLLEKYHFSVKKRILLAFIAIYLATLTD